MNLLPFYTKLVVLAEEAEQDAGWWYNTIVKPVKDALQSVFDWFFDTALGSFFQNLFMFIGLTITGFFYSILASCYRVFQLVCSLNSSTLGGYFAGISNGLTAIVIVIVAYNLASTIIKYLVNPDEAKKSSPKMLRDIFVTAALLLSFNFIISLVNELTLLALGNQTNYTFPILSEIVDIDTTPDNGIVNRLIFGNSEGGDIGEALACSLFELNIQDENEPCNADYFKTIQWNWNKAKEVGTTLTVSGFFIVGQIIAGIMIWNMLKMSCAVIVRMFKLILLQIIAPIAIVSILIDGMEKDSTFRKFVKSYFSVVIEIFVRLFTTLVVIVFIIKFMQSGATFIPDASNTSFIAFVLLVGVAVWGAFTFLNVAPAFIDETLGTKINSSFGNIGNGLLGAMAGMAAGWNKVKANGGNIFTRMSGALQGASDGYDESKRRGASLNNLYKAWGDGDGAGRQAGLDAMERSAMNKQLFSHIPGGAGYKDEKDARDLEKALEDVEKQINDLNNTTYNEDGTINTEGRLSLEERQRLLAERKTSLEAEIKDHNDLKTQSAELSNQISEIDDKINALQSQIDSGTGDISALTAQQDALKSEREAKFNTQREIDTKITENQETIDKKTVELADVTKQEKEVSATLKTKNEEFEKLNTRKETINRQQEFISSKTGYQKRHWTKDKDSDKKSTEQKLLDEMRKFNRK